MLEFLKFNLKDERSEAVNWEMFALKLQIIQLGFPFFVVGSRFLDIRCSCCSEMVKAATIIFDAGNLFFEITFFHPSAGQTKNPAIVCR